jgi:flagellin
MATVINTNMGSLNAVRLLDQSSRSQAVSMERLTSGLRINSSKDDAAGMAVVTNMTSQIRGTDMAIRNGNDGISMVQTADGALETATDILQRMRELGIQGMNATYTDDQREDMDMEFQALNTELERIAATAKFNSKELLGGEDYSFQVGWETNDDDKITMSGYELEGPGGDIKTSDTAKTAVEDVSTTLAGIQEIRASWGGTLNRLDFTVANLQTTSENISASRSRIQDTNYAKEAANLARSQVLQQAGMSMLSQANGNSQNVLSLLR